jgi:hypothetical protein
VTSPGRGAVHRDVLPGTIIIPPLVAILVDQQQNRALLYRVIR